jgi:hypothetical protein
MRSSVAGYLKLLKRESVEGNARLTVAFGTPPLGGRKQRVFNAAA